MRPEDNGSLRLGSAQAGQRASVGGSTVFLASLTPLTHDSPLQEKWLRRLLNSQVALLEDPRSELIACAGKTLGARDPALPPARADPDDGSAPIPPAKPPGRDSASDAPPPWDPETGGAPRGEGPGLGPARLVGAHSQRRAPEAYTPAPHPPVTCPPDREGNRALLRL